MCLNGVKFRLYLHLVGCSGLSTDTQEANWVENSAHLFKKSVLKSGNGEWNELLWRLLVSAGIQIS